jgi:hypothetical protein
MVKRLSLEILNLSFKVRVLMGRLFFKGEFVKRFISILAMSVFMVIGLFAQSMSIKSIAYSIDGQIYECSEGTLSNSEGNGLVCRVSVVNGFYSIQCFMFKNYEIIKSAAVSGEPQGLVIDSKDVYTFTVQGKKISQKIADGYLALNADSLFSGVTFIFGSN